MLCSSMDPSLNANKSSEGDWLGKDLREQAVILVNRNEINY